MFLSDLGAEVVKVEDPTTGGDEARAVPPFNDPGARAGLYYQSLNPRPHGRGGQRPRRLAPRRGRLDAELHGHLDPQPRLAPAAPPGGRAPEPRPQPELPDARRLDCHHVHEGEVLGAAGGAHRARTPARRPALPDLRRPARAPGRAPPDLARGVPATHHGGVARAPARPGADRARVRGRGSARRPAGAGARDGGRGRPSALRAAPRGRLPDQDRRGHAALRAGGAARRGHGGGAGGDRREPGRAARLACAGGRVVDLAFTPAEEAFRAELRGWLRAHLPPSAEPATLADEVAFLRAW